jgi:hypothetical protein
MVAAVENARWRPPMRGRFSLRFGDGAALFDPTFVRVAFLGPWPEIVADAERAPVFAEVQAPLDAAAEREGGLLLDVPFACSDATRGAGHET